MRKTRWAVSGRTRRMLRLPSRSEGRRYLGLDVLARCRLRPVTPIGDISEEVTGQPTIPALSA